MKKRVLAFLLAGMMVLAAGCGSKSMMATENAVAESSAAMDTAYAGSQYEELLKMPMKKTAMDSGSGDLGEWTGVYGGERTETDPDHLSVLTDHGI